MSLVTTKEREQRIQFFARNQSSSIQSIILNHESYRLNPKGRRYYPVQKWN